MTVSNVSGFQLPDPAGRASGACTATLLKVLYEYEEKPWGEENSNLTFIDVMNRMRKILKQKGFQQIPQLSSTKPIDMNKDEFTLVPETLTGTRRAVLIGINYVGHKKGELSGCHNDVFNMYMYLQDYYGFQDEDITVLVDDGDHERPTKSAILNAYNTIVRQSQPGDAIFLHYSGHGTKVKDLNGDEDDGYDEAIMPVDYKKNGIIIDDELNDLIVKRLPAGVHVVALYDCCHSGTVLDLPYEYIANGKYSRMEISDSKFNINKIFTALLGGGGGSGSGGKNNNNNKMNAMKIGKMIMQNGRMANKIAGKAGFVKQFLK